MPQPRGLRQRLRRTSSRPSEAAAHRAGDPRGPGEVGRRDRGGHPALPGGAHPRRGGAADPAGVERRRKHEGATRSSNTGAVVLVVPSRAAAGRSRPGYGHQHLRHRGGGRAHRPRPDGPAVPARATTARASSWASPALAQQYARALRLRAHRRGPAASRARSPRAGGRRVHFALFLVIADHPLLPLRNRSGRRRRRGRRRGRRRRRRRAGHHPLPDGRWRWAGGGFGGGGFGGGGFGGFGGGGGLAAAERGAGW